MKPCITVLAGIAGSGKTTELLALYRDALRAQLDQGRPGTALWLTPTNRARAELRDKLLDGSLPAVFRPNLATFDAFADQVLNAAPRPATPLSPAMQRILLRRIVTQLAREKRLEHFGKIAGTSGFLDLVSAFIAELKRSQTWPEVFIAACTERGTKPRDRELGWIYTRYQEALLAGKVYDGEGRFWSAREALEAGHWGRFADLSLVVVDGFTDFTEAQYKILELLAQKAGRMLMGLLYEAPTARSDLFAKTRGVIERLEVAAEVVVQSRLPAGGEHRGGAAALPLAIDHLARSLFANPREVAPERNADGVEVVAVAGQAGEVKLLAARVKRLLLDGVSPGQIVVALRDLDGYAGLIHEIFSAAGIPYACEAGTPLSRIAPFKALANLLALQLEDWPFRRLMALLDSGLFRPRWNDFAGGSAVRDVAAALRRNDLDQGRERILASLEWSACPRVADDELTAATPSSSESLHQAAASRALRLLQRLSEATSELRRSHDLDGWSGVIATLAREFGFDQIPLTDESAGPDREFRKTLAAILFDAARAERVAGIEPAKLSLAEFSAELNDLVEHQRLAPRGSEEGCVRVLSAEQVRNLDVPYLFLAGLTERSFPQNRGDDCLYGEGERRELNRLGLSLGHRAQRAQEELLMFYGIVTRARQQLVLTYPIVASDGQPLSPSPYLAGLTELFERAALKSGLEEELDPVPRRERVLSAADVRVHGMQEALAGRPALFRALCERHEGTGRELAAAAGNCLAAIEMNIRRFHTVGFTNYEGRLENPRNTALLRERFSPDREFSATQLEAYARCPFRFFMSHVLAIEPVAAPEIETDYGRRGTLIHEILAELHKALFESRTASGAGQEVTRGEEVAMQFQKLLDEKLRQRSPASQIHAALAHIEQRLLAEWGIAYGRQWDDYVAGLPRDADAPLMPARFETAFGSLAKDAATETGAMQPLVFGEGSETVRVGGRIDRIDVGRVEGAAVFTVIDYKSGRRAATTYDTLESGRLLQLVLYTLAATRLELAGEGALPWQLGYWHIRETGFASGAKQRRTKSAGPLPRIEEAAWDALVQMLEQIIPRLASGIRSGQFPVYNADPQCTAGCPYNTVCRVAQIRALPDELGKTRRP